MNAGKIIAATGMLFCIGLSFALPVDSQDVENAFKGWLNLEPRPLETSISPQIGRIEPFSDASGRILYYVAYLEPEGFVIFSGDDDIEPVIAFSQYGTYDPSGGNPLGAMISLDMPKRYNFLEDWKQLKSAAGSELVADARRKWQSFKAASDGQPAKSGVSSISDVCVAPMVQSRWSQSGVGGKPCYNYYTPNNYVCGCVATAMAQILRHHQFPAQGIGVLSNTIEVDGHEQTAQTRGGDGSGGPYDWQNMPHVPSSSMTQAQRQAIGALCYDAGVACQMSYNDGWSGSTENRACNGFLNYFGFASGFYFMDYGYTVSRGFQDKVLQPNLDAGYPVQVGITGDGGHEIVCDGYGYSGETIYHHMNMGWGGYEDMWYNLPDIGTPYNFTIVDGFIFNLFPETQGEIVSGRLLFFSGDSAADTEVVLRSQGGQSITANTNDKGIFYFTEIVPDTYYIEISQQGFIPQSIRVNVSQSASTRDVSGTCGNVWAGDIVLNLEGSGYSGGEGTEQSPYLVSTAADILELSQMISDYDKHFVMTDDIDLAGMTFDMAVIAPDVDFYAGYQGTAFTGDFDGGGFCIQNLNIDLLSDDDPSNDGNDYIGLFGMIKDGARVSNLAVSGSSIVSGWSSNYAGIIAGCVNLAEVSGCDVRGSSISAGSYSRYTGGICGCLDEGRITRSMAAISIQSQSYVGGICGYNDRGNVDFCFSTGTVRGSERAGGICGSNYYSNLSYSYSQAETSATKYVGGVSGYNSNTSLSQVYAKGKVTGSLYTGGLCGFALFGSAEACFWCPETTTQAKSVLGSPSTKQEMSLLSTFENAGWDFASDQRNWYMPASGSPLLNWQMRVEDFRRLSLMSKYWHEDCGGNCGCLGYDYSGNGSISAEDLSILATNWLYSVNAYE
ncbi:Streptopain precursor [Limihaloglobus sulfuriphilus]|uniref:Streptopain n=1 Tax=Limihaloglobus sulfuriphilus TaxID=1851148 RepID=A0A1Q2MJ46_9BACT|nr:C10 family peptidase [Limihaloglobus sulfuriphilus]AQQ72417.1 Streptopain precursor [Limihaloglobus sulfuriphilus]